MQGCRNRGENREGEEEDERKRRCRKKRRVTLARRTPGRPPGARKGRPGGRRRSIMGEKERVRVKWRVGEKERGWIGIGKTRDLLKTCSFD